MDKWTRIQGKKIPFWSLVAVLQFIVAGGMFSCQKLEKYQNSSRYTPRPFERNPNLSTQDKEHRLNQLTYSDKKYLQLDVPVIDKIDLEVQEKEFRFAFGSCHNNHLNNPLASTIWNSILTQKPMGWIWLGDTVYADTRDESILRKEYSLLKNNSQYRALTKEVRFLIGTWDDHDYGENNQGKFFPFKEKSQEVFLDFYNIAKGDPRRSQFGVYSLYTLKWREKIIRIVLLDVRFFRDNLGTNGTILGDGQWNWLTKVLSLKGDLFIIGTGVQFLPDEHEFEKWADFPKERDRLIGLLEHKLDEPQVLFLSGDRHFAEISEGRFGVLQIYEMTSSGLTHHAEGLKKSELINRYRKGSVLNDLNYGMVHFIYEDKSNKSRFRGEIKNAQGRAQESIEFSF